MKNARPKPDPRTDPPYDFFARIYDSVMAHVPLADWADYLCRRIVSFGIEVRGNTLVDLACGTGSLLELLMKGPLAGQGIRAVGVDSSAGMLDLARKKAEPRGRGDMIPLFTVLSGDLCESSLASGSADWVLCTHDSINYLRDESQVARHFREVRRLLTVGGIYSFDVVTEDNIIREFHGEVREEFIDGIFLHWNNFYDKSRRLLTSDLTFQDGTNTVSETHLQTYFDRDQISTAAIAAGFEILAVEGDYKMRAPRVRDAFMNFHLKART